jgi:DNA-binding LacI/PurR family transcriptional regulator
MKCRYLKVKRRIVYVRSYRDKICDEVILLIASYKCDGTILLPEQLSKKATLTSCAFRVAPVVMIDVELID